MLNIRRVLRKNLFFISLRLRSNGEDPKEYVVRRNVTDICIDGYPRSANSFAVRMFRKANSNAVIAHHTHSVGNIKEAIRFGLPVVVLIRKPEQSIVSSVIAHKNNDINEEMYRYIDFYSWVLEHIGDVVIADFDKVTNDFNSVISDVNKRFGKSYDVLKSVEDADNQVKKDIEKRYDALGQSKMSHIKPLPTNKRSQEKEKLSELVLAHSEFKVAKAIYQNIMKSIFYSSSEI